MEHLLEKLPNAQSLARCHWGELLQVVASLQSRWSADARQKSSLCALVRCTKVTRHRGRQPLCVHGRISGEVIRINHPSVLVTLALDSSSAPFKISTEQNYGSLQTKYHTDVATGKVVEYTMHSCTRMDSLSKKFDFGQSNLLREGCRSGRINYGK